MEVRGYVGGRENGRYVGGRENGGTWVRRGKRVWQGVYTLAMSVYIVCGGASVIQTQIDAVGNNYQCYLL